MPMGRRRKKTFFPPMLYVTTRKRYKQGNFFPTSALRGGEKKYFFSTSAVTTRKRCSQARQWEKKDYTQTRKKSCFSPVRFQQDKGNNHSNKFAFSACSFKKRKVKDIFSIPTVSKHERELQYILGEGEKGER